MLTFAKMHLDGGVAGDGTRLLSEASVHEMQRPQFTLPGMAGEFASHWGLGWMLFDWGGRRVIGHDGGTIGQQSSMRILPEERFGVAVLTNSMSGSLLASRVMRWLFGQTMGVEVPPRPMPPESPPEIDLTPYEGVYERLGFRITIALSGGVLSVQTVNTGPLATAADQFPAQPMYAADSSVFLLRSPLGTFQPVVFSEFDSEGRPRYMYAGRVARRVVGQAS
jgi:CubicO group peptidase (beta-lactamase class C family)